MGTRGKKRTTRARKPTPARPPVSPPERQGGPLSISPEQRNYASFWQRLAAALIDWPIAFGMAWMFRGLADALALDWINEPIIGSDAPNWSTLGIYLSVSMLPLWLYEALFVRSRWQATPGKRVLGIAVTDLSGARISFLRATGRYFAANLSWFMVFGYVFQPFTAKRQALHDLIAGTIVVREKFGMADGAKRSAPSMQDASAAPLPQAGRKGR